MVQEVARRATDGILLSDVVVDNGVDETASSFTLSLAVATGLVKLPGAMTNASRIIHARRMERILCDLGILRLLRSIFM